MLEANGFVIVNDPHNASKAPRSRLDVDYGGTILGKLEQIRDRANAEKLVPLFTGDFFQKPIEPSEAIKSRLNDLLYSFWSQQGIIIPGNHDMRGDILSETDSLWNIKTGRSIRVFPHAGFFDTFLINGKKVSVGGSPFGQAIPDDVERDGDVDEYIWLTHHNLPFKNNYKTSEQKLAFKEIVGVDKVFNGHIHTASPSVTSGMTTYFNIGSMTRTSVSDAERKPVFGIYKDGNLFTEHLECEPHVFDLSYRTERAKPGVSGRHTIGDAGAQFLSAIADDGRGNEFDIANWLKQEVSENRCSDGALRFIKNMLDR